MTDNYAISLCSRGVIKERKENFQEAESEWLQNGIERIKSDGLPWVRYETTLFVGERVLSVIEKDRKYLVEFDDFTLNVVPCITDDEITGFRNKDHWSYNYVLGCNRHLKRNCPHCHGEGEILLDFVSDFVVRCKNCKQSTYRQMILINAINEWNDGHVDCDLSDITIEQESKS